MSSRKKKKKGFFPAKPPDMFLLSYAALATLLLAFFIIINTFTEEKNKKMVEAFQKSFQRNAITLGMGGLLPGSSSMEESKNIHDMKYTFYDDDMDDIPAQTGDKEVDKMENEADHIPAAAVIYFKEHGATLSLEGMHSLNNLVHLTADRPVLLMVEGHTRVAFKPSKDYETSWELSVDRARAVADYLHEKGNISHKRLITVGHGNNNSFVKSPGGDRFNDRVSIIIKKLR